MAAILSVSNGEAMSSVRTKLNSVITEINLLDPTDWIDYSATSTIVGWSSFTTKIIKYRIIGKQMFVMVNIQGTSNSTTTTYTLPFNPINENNFLMHVGINNGTGVQARADITKNSNIITHIYWTGTAAVSSYTNTGTKGIFTQYFIEIA